MKIKIKESNDRNFRNSTMVQNPNGTAESKINELQSIAKYTTQYEQQKQNRLPKVKQSLLDIWNNNQTSNVHFTDLDKRKNWAEIFQNLPNDAIYIFRKVDKLKLQ